MGQADGQFLAGTTLPDKRETLAKVGGGQAGREIAAAVFDGDRPKVAALLARDPTLARTHAGETDLLRIAIGRNDLALVQQLLAAGAPPDGPPGTANPPLELAMKATKPDFAHALLKAGANANPLPNGQFDPLYEAAANDSTGQARMLLDFGANPNEREPLGITPLLYALNASSFRVAELLLERGAEPWVVDQSGDTAAANLDNAALLPLGDNEAARRRLKARFKALGWPDPAPNAQATRALVMAGRWPPPNARPRVPVILPVTLANMRAFYFPDGTPRPLPHREDAGRH